MRVRGADSHPATEAERGARAGRSPKPLIKICGITTVGDALRAVELGADLLGLNFHPPSPRYLEVEEARAIVTAVRAAGRAAREEDGRARPGIVGVFVDRPRREIEELDRAIAFDLVQFHGDEGPEDLRPFGPRAIKVFRLEAGGVAEPPFSLYPEAWGFLFDIRHPTLYGGTGAEWNYGSLAGLAANQGLAGRPCLVAGGIRPGNARRALAESGAAGLDVCSGVEAAPGEKDRRKLERLMREVLEHGTGKP